MGPAMFIVRPSRGFPYCASRRFWLDARFSRASSTSCKVISRIKP